MHDDPRIGVYGRCRYVVGEIHPVTGKVYNVTHMHHEAYDSSDVLAHPEHLEQKFTFNSRTLINLQSLI
jgi:hypothetical protein